jgi:ArsR family transcriptional regulator
VTRLIRPIDLFRALADDSRLRVLALLRAMELSVGELAQVLGQSQPRVSRHVKILCDAGLARRRKEGSWVFVALGEADTVAPIAAALDAWGQDEGGAADLARLAAVRADRTAQAQAWFQAHAGEWDAIRALHVADEAVEAAMAGMLGAGMPGDGAPHGAGLGVLVDVGTGTGRMLELFGARATRAVGIDRSSEMLRLARAKLADAGLSAVELRQADLYQLPLAEGEADAVLLHHVLHFVQAPGQAIAEAARVLGPGGRLLVADFAPHAREELRIEQGHLRLGFADDQVAQWFGDAGLALSRTETLGGAELTVKLWLGRCPGARLKEAKAA